VIGVVRHSETLDTVNGCTRAGLNSFNITHIENPPSMPVTGDLFDSTQE
jgi:hypothetical protein